MELVKKIESANILKKIILVFLGTVLLTISAKIKVPFYPVPMTMQTFVVVLIGITLGWKLGLTTIFLYLFEGAVGLPVFAGTPEKGLGISYMIGPTGGYLVGFVLSVFIAGFVNLNKNIFVKFLLITLSIFAIYITGVPWLAYLAGWEVAYVWGIKNFLLAEFLKISILVLISKKLLKVRNFI
ncbi:biotin transporter BioY [Candidatus Pelagibacter sp.]|nr:biotin transporter BioY [Candidatus Pelagibacter sp.]|tara:strand:+ start:61 stop:609 length:549 start_codon:yes stop_codon:yes gene_type:complete